MSDTCAVFPLSTVLFPGGVLPLRIFEPRYLSMVSECMRSGSEFAVALITQGSEAGKPAEFHPRATLAQIIDFDQLEDGMLGVTCKGTQMVDISETYLQPDNLIRARIERVENELFSPCIEKDENLRDFLRQVLASAEMTEYRIHFDEDWENRVWISHRLSELLPVSVSNKLSLMQADTTKRMEILCQILQHSNVI